MTSVAVLASRYLFTASWDKTIKVWNLTVSIQARAKSDENRTAPYSSRWRDTPTLSSRSWSLTVQSLNSVQHLQTGLFAHGISPLSCWVNSLS